MTYISTRTLKEWREDAERRADAADAHLVFAARIVRLVDALGAPCGSCHPCTEWAAETWRQTGGPLPHKYQVDEAFAALERVRALADQWERDFANFRREDPAHLAIRAAMSPKEQP